MRDKKALNKIMPYSLFQIHSLYKVYYVIRALSDTVDPKTKGST